MRRQSRTGDAESAVLAAGQHGVVSRAQLLALGFGPGAIDRRVRQGRLHTVFRGVYAVGHAALPPLGRTHAAVLACEPHALLSYRSAAELWGLIRTSRWSIDVTVVGRKPHGQRGTTLHTARALRPEDWDERERIRVASVARTLLDLAEVATRPHLERAWDQAERLELLDLNALAGLLTRSSGRRGLKPLSELIAEARMPEPTKSELEDMLRDICEAYGIPLPAFNVTVAGEEVDAFWASHDFVVELDGWRHHSTRRDRERDLLKEERIKLAGYRFMRFSYRRVANDPEGVAAVLRKCLGDAATLVR